MTPVIHLEKRQQATCTPAPVKDRNQVIDIIRGFALFGILLVNTPSLNTPAFMDTDDFAFKSSYMDNAVTNFIFTFAMESFYPIFALLFGIGAAIFLSNKGQDAAKLYSRRIACLLIIGIFHACFVWWGDILIVYAILGSGLILFYNRSAKTVGLWVLAIMLTVWSLSAYLSFFAPDMPTKLWPSTDLIYAHGSFLEISKQRVHDYIQAFFLNDTPVDLFTYFLDMFGIMLLGMWVHKMGILSNVPGHRRLISIVAAVALAIATMCVITNDFLDLKLDMLSPIKGLCTGIFYISVVALVAATRRGFLALRPLAYNGRMSLTNYLGFNLALSLIFYGYGLGLYGSLGPAQQMPIVLGLYLSFLFFSAVWLKYFSYGPCEWLWRSFTYKTWLIAKKRSAAEKIAHRL